MSEEPLTVLNVSGNRDPGWNWFAGQMPTPVTFQHFDRRVRTPYVGDRLGSRDIDGYRACAQGAWHAIRGRGDVLITHLPIYTLRTEIMCGMLRGSTPHLAFAFNFFPLPTGARDALMKRFCPQVDRFVTYSSMERPLYAERFGIPEERIEFIPWSMAAPALTDDDPPIREGEYLCAVGRTGRDYAVLIDALKRLPHCRAVIVASPQNMAGLDVPSNVEVLTDIPFSDVLNVMRRARFMVLPVAYQDAPFGHGALVLAMYLRKAVIATKSKGFDDYIVDGESGITFPFGDDAALAERIDALWKDPDAGERVADAAYAFATENCSEQATIDWLAGFLEEVRAGTARVG